MHKSYKLILLFACICNIAYGQFASQGAAHGAAVFPAARNIGTIFSDNFATSTIGNYSTTIPNATVTTPGDGYMHFINNATPTGNNTDWVSYSAGTYAGTQASMLPYFEITMEFEMKNRTTTSYGVAIGTEAVGSFGPVRLTGFFDCRTASAGSMGLVHKNGATIQVVGSTATMLSTSVNDKIRLKMKREDMKWTLVAYNLTTHPSLDDSTVCTYTFLTSSYAITSPNLWKYAMYSNGGTQDVSLFKLTTSVKKNQQAIFVGNSISQGYRVTTTADRYSSLVFAASTKTNFSLFATQGSRTRDMQKITNELILCRPKFVFINAGANDLANTETPAAYIAEVIALNATLKAANINVIMSENFPSAYDAASYNTQLNATYTNVVPMYTSLKSGGTTLNATYDSGDGLHPNSAGNVVIANNFKVLKWIFYIP